MNQRTIVLWSALALLVYCAFLVYLGATLTPERAEALFSETGWFEDLSAFLWFLLGVILFLADRRSRDARA